MSDERLAEIEAFFAGEPRTWSFSQAASRESLAECRRARAAEEWLRDVVGIAQNLIAESSLSDEEAVLLIERLGALRDEVQ